MRIGIDISQLAYEKSGVANYLKNLVEELLMKDSKNEYILFYASLRRQLPDGKFWENGMPKSTDLKVKSLRIHQIKIPPTLLDLLWNKLHIIPIETFIGPVDVFISSDWTQPPSKAKKVTILYDLIVYKYPKETSQKIIDVQKKKLAWVTKEVDRILCISKATKKDAEEILGIPSRKLTVVYPGL